jgi:hypothetical protein
MSLCIRSSDNKAASVGGLFLRLMFGEAFPLFGHPQYGRAFVFIVGCTSPKRTATSFSPAPRKPPTPTINAVTSRTCRTGRP